MSDLQRLKVKAAFDDFMQDMYDEEELQYMDSGFVNALWLAFYQAWCAAIESVVVELPRPSSEVDYGYELNDIQNLLTDAGIKYE